LAILTSFTEARAHLAALLERASQDREIVIITRRSMNDVALIAADELAGLLETIHLLRSPANAERLLAALERAKAGIDTPSSADDLRREFGLVSN
jgi:antitoxin YefM